MATKNFTQFSTTTLTSGDYIVGYKEDGSAEFRSPVQDIVNLVQDSDNQTLSFNEASKDLAISSGNTVSLSALIDAEVEEAPEDSIIYGRKDAGWVDLTAPGNLQVRRGTAAEVASIIPLEGEPVWATDTKFLYIGDGTTQGGISTTKGEYTILPVTQQAVFNSDTLTPITSLSSLSLDPSSIYEFNLRLQFFVDGAGGLKIAVNEDSLLYGQSATIREITTPPLTNPPVYAGNPTITTMAGVFYSKENPPSPLFTILDINGILRTWPYIDFNINSPFNTPNISFAQFTATQNGITYGGLVTNEFGQCNFAYRKIA